MKKVVCFSLLFLAFMSCNYNQDEKKKVDQHSEDEISLDLFKHPTLNEEFLKYLEIARNSYRGDKIHVISFESADRIEFTGLLGVEKTNLIGHISFGSDIILIYDNKNVASKYIKVGQLENDSITRFPYFENMDDAPPFDPPSVKLDLTEFDKGF